MEKPHPLVQAYCDTILGFEPPSYAKMNHQGALHKYTKVVIGEGDARTYPPLTSKLVQAHLRGEITVAACLIDPQGKARAAVLDIDHGDELTLRRVLELALLQGFAGFAQSSKNDEHQGGHVWFLFSERTDPKRLRRLAQHLATQAGIEAETYPTKKTIRLPLGVHRWTHTRGRLLLSDGTVFELDEGEAVVRQAVRILSALTPNDISLLPPLPTSVAPVESSPVRLKSADPSASIIARFNQTQSLVALLERSGGKIAQQLPSGAVLMHCPCPFHKNGDSRPSLELRPAKNKARYGEFVAFGYAPGCQFYTQSGQVIDAFSAMCLLDGLTPAEAVQKLKG